nr:MAG TPA: hypothetical protein [Caudoviricetes sp.]
MLNRIQIIIQSIRRHELHKDLFHGLCSLWLDSGKTPRGGEV